MRNLFFKKINRLPRLLQLGITPTAIALLQSSGWWNARMRILAQSSLSADDGNAPELLSDALRRILKEAACANRPVTVALADEWTRMFMVTPPRNTANLEDCRAAVSMRFSQLYGDNLGGWELQADWQANQPFLVCAIPAWLLGAIKAVAIEHRLTLLSIVPQFVIAWNRWHAELKGDDWFGIGHGDSMTFAAISQNALCWVRTIPLEAAAAQDPQWLLAHLKREALRMNVPPPRRIRLCGIIPDPVFAGADPALHCIRLDTRRNAAQEKDASSAVALVSGGRAA